jgi:hypothetical protein
MAVNDDGGHESAHASQREGCERGRSKRAKSPTAGCSWLREWRRRQPSDFPPEKVICIVTIVILAH